MMDVSKLAAPFSPDVVSWRVGPTNKEKTKGMALAYIDARDVQDRLTEVCGPFGWQCRHEVSGDKRVTCHIGVKCPETGEWIWRSDGAGETDVDGEKGSYSDSFKRAAVKWGIGRYLYDIDSPWVAIEAFGRSFSITAAERKRLAGMLSRGRPEPPPPPAPDAEKQQIVIALSKPVQSFLNDLGGCITVDELKSWAAKVHDAHAKGTISDDEYDAMRPHVDARKQFIAARQETA
jgi:hypothetical protein